MIHDLIVCGGGPAGAAAALEAAGRGLDVLLLDEQRDGGGQVHRPPDPAVAANGAVSADGDALRGALAESRVTPAFAHRVWHLEADGDGFLAAVVGPGGTALEARSRALVVAAGAQERILPVPGWTLPGVFGLAAATILLKAHRVLPGRRVVVAGAGPLLLLVAAGIVKAGGTVAAVVDLDGTGAWLSTVPRALARPDLVARGTGWWVRTRLARVPMLTRSAVLRIEGDGRVERVVVGAVDADGTPRHGAPERTLDADALCLGHGLLPATEATRLLGARHHYDADLGGWIPFADADGAASVPGLFVCGDGAGIRGAAAASAGGRVAGLAAARHVGVAPEPGRHARLRRRFRRAARFGAALAPLTRPRPGLADAITADTVVCRCEEITRAALDAEIAAGAVSGNALKAATRCGMGPCGGRFCGEALAMLIARATGVDQATIPPPTARPALRAVPIGHVAGAVDYADLPMPEPAPL